MSKTQIELPVLLPQVPNEKDSCVKRLIAQLETREGIQKVHLAVNKENNHPVLCFHYDPQFISLDRIISIAKSTGAKITDAYGHILIEVTGVRHIRHARIIERAIREEKGILEASVSGGGIIRLEFERGITSFESIEAVLKKEDLIIKKKSLAARNFENITTKDLPRDAEKSRKKVFPHQEQESHEKGKPHAHAHTHIHAGRNTELIFSVISGVLLGIGFTLSFIGSIPVWTGLSLYIAAYFFGGFYTAKEAIQTVARGGFEIDFLMLVAAVGAAILGAWAEGALLLFLFSLGHALEHYAMNKARKSIAALAALAPKTALLKRDHTTEVIKIEDLLPGDIIVVKPHTRIGADGVVVKGSGSVNQAPITGESVPVDKVAIENFGGTGDDIRDINRVFAGTLNGNNKLEIKVLKAAKDSTLARLVKLVKEAQTQKSPTQLLTDRFEKYYVPGVLVLVFLLLFVFLIKEEPFSASFYRAMAVLVAASPCALAISTPSAVLSGVARAARGGVLIKGGRPLEDLGDLTALAFDKTGTLTEGKPKLTRVVPLGNMEENELLRIAVAVEQLSDHPLAEAVVRYGLQKLKGQNLQQASQLEAVMGRGIRATYGNDRVYIGNLQLYKELDGFQPSAKIKKIVKELETDGNTTMLLRKNEEYIGILALMDTPRKAARDTLLKLKELGIKRMVMLSGDNQQVANAVAKEIGLTEAWGNLLPDEKVAAIKKLKEKESKVAMVGDGVNDAPAMAHSTVGIAMGAASSEVALETADVALMANKLETLPFAIGLSRKTKAIIKQNLWVSLGIVALLLPATIFGLANIGIAVVIHEGSTLLVVFNALRLLGYKYK